MRDEREETMHSRSNETAGFSLQPHKNCIEQCSLTSIPQRATTDRSAGWSGHDQSRTRTRVCPDCPPRERLVTATHFTYIKPRFSKHNNSNNNFKQTTITTKTAQFQGKAADFTLSFSCGVRWLCVHVRGDYGA